MSDIFDELSKHLSQLKPFIIQQIVAGYEEWGDRRIHHWFHVSLPADDNGDSIGVQCEAQCLPRDNQYYIDASTMADEIVCNIASESIRGGVGQRILYSDVSVTANRTCAFSSESSTNLIGVNRWKRAHNPTTY